MLAAPIPGDDEVRLAAIARYGLDGIGRERAFDHATELAATTFGVPMSTVSIVAADQQLFKGATGLDGLCTGRDVSFCGHAILADEVFVVEDALADPRFADNPFVTGEPHVRFYAGAQLRLACGNVPGTLCLIDSEPRLFRSEEREALARLARLVVDIIELRLDGVVAEDRHRALSRLKDDFISTTSHELRTPLTSINGSLALLGAAATDLPEKARRLLDIAQSNGRRLARLVNDILDFSKLAAGHVDLELADLPVAGVLEEALEANGNYGAAREVALELGAVEPGLVVRADAHRLQQVLANLVSNAVKFSPAGSSVTMTARGEGDRVVLAVTDRGRGIPESHRGRVFERFEQVEQADAKDKGGTGLGLAIVREIVTLHGGEIDFDSEVGAGTTFRVSLPRA